MLHELEGFDWLRAGGGAGADLQLLSEWTSNPPTIGTITGRFGEGHAFSAVAADSFGVFRKFQTPIAAGVITGAAVLTGGSLNQIISFIDGDHATRHLVLRAAASPGVLEVRRSTVTGTVLGTGTFPIATGRWYYIEFRAVIHDTLGEIEVRVNGVTDILATGIDTRNGGGGTIGDILYTNSAFDDIYILDDTGADYNDFLGEIRIGTKRPNGAGTTTDWTPSTGSNHQNVDEVGPNSDTDYNSSSTPGDIDTYALTAVPSTPSAIVGVKTVLVHRKDDAGSRTIRHVLRSGGTDSEGPDVPILDNYVASSRLMAENPVTAAPFTPSEVSSLEAGIKLEA